MINPSYGAPAFIARLISVFCLGAEFLFPVVKSLISLVHDAGGRVFSISVSQPKNFQNVLRSLSKSRYYIRSAPFPEF